MSQGEGVGNVDLSVGYVLKQAATALRTSMDAVLRPMELTVPQYACLELLGQREGLSSAELARGVFVTRQAMNQVLRGLQERGLLARPTAADHGRALPSRLTPEGERVLRAASRAVAEVEQQMLGAFDDVRRQRLLEDLNACIAALSDTNY